MMILSDKQEVNIEKFIIIIIFIHKYLLNCYHAAAETQVLSRLRRANLCVMSKTAVKTGREMVKCGIGYANVLEAFDVTIGIIKYRHCLYIQID